MKKNILGNLKKIISKYDTYILFAFLLICSIGHVMFIQLSEADEIWNFQNVLKLYNGFKIYIDANIIVTPLFFYIGVVFLKVLGSTFLTFKIYNIILISILALLVYKSFIALKINKLKSLIYTLIIYETIIYIGTCGANYNVLVIVFFITGVLLSIKKNVINSKIYNLSQGIIIFLIFLTKQNIAVYYTISLVLSELVDCKYNYKIFIKSITIKIIIALMFILIFLCILSLNSYLNNFINYTVLGIPEFSYNFAIEVDAIWSIGIIGIIFTIAILSLFHKNNYIDINDEKKNNIIKLLIFGTFMEFTVYPIFNLYHSMLGGYVIYILGFYLLDIIFIENFYKLKRYLITIARILIIILLSHSLYNLVMYMYFMSVDSCPKIQVYENTIVKDDLQDEILNLDKYIIYKERLGVRVVIFSQSAALYMVPLNKSNGDIDLPFLGNMGKNGELDMLEKLKGLKNTEVLLIKDDKKVFWQESKTIRKYIIDNFKYIGEIEKFNIYVL